MQDLRGLRRHGTLLCTGKILLTGNPVRQGLTRTHLTKEEALKQFGLAPEKKTILILGGSLGARTINRCVMNHFQEIAGSDVQFIWQTGKFYINEAKEAVRAFSKEKLPMLHVTDFISDMAAAYRAADLIISRAGAGSISNSACSKSRSSWYLRPT